MNQHWSSVVNEDGNQSEDTPTIVSFADLLENQLDEPQLAAFVKFLGQVEEHADGSGMINIVASLITLCFRGKEAFISNAKRHMGVTEDTKYDRFLNSIWNNYLKDLALNQTVVLDTASIEAKMLVYSTIMQDIRKLALFKNHETWPHVLKPGEELENY